MLGQLAKRTCWSCFSRIKVEEVLPKSYQELVELVATRYVLPCSTRAIVSSNIPTLLLSTKFSISSKSSALEMPYLTLVLGLNSGGLILHYPSPKTQPCPIESSLTMCK